ncbi:hypothetical protein FRC10_007537, partial [Ceratobasidium sp. 414]
MSTGGELGSSSSVFKIPELVTLICNFLDRQQCSPLALTCRLCFPVAAARVWERVENARILLQLVRTDNFLGERYKEYKDNAVMSFHGPGDFGRFDVYAPFVKHLDAYGKEHKYFKVTEWHTLLRRARERPLLPNLLSLTLHAADSRFAPDQVLWISAFASPSLLRFTPVYIRDSDKCLISDTATSIILKALNERCPNIQSLALYRQMETDPDEGDVDSFLNLMWDGPYLQYMQSLAELRALSISISMIDGDGLTVLGSLPRLGSLTIRGGDDYLEEPNFAIPDNSFPQLTHLTLWEIHVRIIADLMAIEPLARNLAALSLCHQFAVEDEAAEMAWFTETIPRLLQYTPRLNDFYCDSTYNPSSFPLDLSPCIISGNLLQRTSELGLKKMYLSGLRFTSLEHLEMMPTAWSTLISLHLTHVFISPLALPLFAMLPELQFLALRLPLGVYPSWPIFDEYNPGLALRTLETTETELQIHIGANAVLTARSLLSLWPGLRCILWPAAQAGPPLAVSYLHMLNESLQTLDQRSTELGDIE